MSFYIGRTIRQSFSPENQDDWKRIEQEALRKYRPNKENLKENLEAKLRALITTVCLEEMLPLEVFFSSSRSSHTCRVRNKIILQAKELQITDVEIARITGLSERQIRHIKLCHARLSSVSVVTSNPAKIVQPPLLVSTSVPRSYTIVSASPTP